MNSFKKIIGSLTLLSTLGLSTEALGLEYDCASTPPEMPGRHNMIVFGDPQDEIYAYHLPLFPGEVNGSKGHVLMHVYQSIWNINLDPMSFKAYRNKFQNQKSNSKRFPFFSLSPKGKSFKVPDVICTQKFSFDAQVVSGHVESNPLFPKPGPITNRTSKVKIKGASVFAKRFNGQSKENLTYILFGSSKNLYLAHHLSTSENSFDQILKIERNKILWDALQKTKKRRLFLTFLKRDNPSLVKVANGASGANQSLSLPTQRIGLKVFASLGAENVEVTLSDLIYYNENRDLKIN